MSDHDAARPLAGRRALVTGAAQGIGSAIADALAEAGALVVASGRDAARLGDYSRQLRARTGAQVYEISADISSAAEVERLAAGALAAFDGLDILVNNAGVSFPEPLVDITADRWDAVMAVNVRAPALLAARIGAAMARAGHGGSIVNIASAAATTALAEHYSYCTSKAALVMITKMLALELGPANIRSNVICPTVVMTEMGQRVWGDPQTAAPLLGRVPIGRFAQPGDVAAAVLYLVSDASGIVNGARIDIDGGYSVA